MRTKNENITLIKKLSDANGISGFEDEVVELCKAEIKEVADFDEDSLRNLYFSSKVNTGNRPKVWLDAHTDEVGFIVQHLKSNGTIQFLPVGGWLPPTVLASKVRIKRADGSYISGVVGAKPPHFASEAERNAGITIEQMSMDVGAKSLDELKNKFKIPVAAPIIPDVACSYDEQHDLFLGKAFDCRIGVAALIETLNQTASGERAVDIVGTFSAQEEVGLRGARAVANRVAPDFAICLEGAPADDTFAEAHMVQTRMGKGPMLRIIDSGMITNPRALKLAREVAAKEGIAIQEAVRTGGGTNGGAIHMSGNGVPVIVISCPVRYAHSHHSMASYSDYKACVALVVAIVKGLNEEIIKGF